jgi:hypothetical protein
MAAVAGITMAAAVAGITMAAAMAGVTMVVAVAGVTMVVEGPTPTSHGHGNYSNYRRYGHGNYNNYKRYGHYGNYRRLRLVRASYIAYGYGGGCGWLYRNALATGDPYWWNRYYECTGYY